MDDTQSKIVEDLVDISSQLLRKAQPLLDEIYEFEDSDLIDEMDELFPDLSFKDKENLVQRAILELVNDARQVVKEVVFFRQALENNDIDNCDCEFLSQVWHGDAYDVTEFRALQILLEELRRQKERVNEEGLLEVCKKLKTKEGLVE